MTPYDVYKIVDVLVDEQACPAVLREKLEAAMRAGSSGIEILGAIRSVFVDSEYSDYIDTVLSTEHLTTRKDIILYVDHLFGRQT